MVTQHIFVGVIPHGIQPGDEVLITVFDSGEAQIAFRLPGESNRWEPGYALTPRSAE